MLSQTVYGGKPFAIGAIKYDSDGIEQDRFSGRCPIQDEVNEWVKNNVIPALEDFEVTHDTYKSLLEDFAKWWMINKKDSELLWHMGHIVEANLFIELHRLKFIRDFDGPYTPIELSVILRENMLKPDSVDEYIKSRDLTIPNIGGGIHNPLYDAIATASVYFDLL